MRSPPLLTYGHGLHGTGVMRIGTTARLLVPPSLSTGLLGYWIRRLAGRATCVMEPGVQLLPTARIHNVRGVNEAIRIGAYSVIRAELLVFAHGGQLSIGEYCYVGEGTRIWAAQSIAIGDRVFISHNVNIFDNLTHPMSPSARHQQFLAISTRGHPRTIDLGERPVTISSDVLIAAGATILRGVTIGRGAVVGAGSIVTKDVPEYSIVAGNPARLIRELSAEERV